LSQKTTIHKPPFEHYEKHENPADTLQICDGLVTLLPPRLQYHEKIDQDSRLLVLSHFSVKEYLISGRLLGHICYFQLSRYCPAISLRRLVFHIFCSSIVRIWISRTCSTQSWPGYGVKEWDQHALAGDLEVPSMARSILRLLSPGNTMYNIRFYIPEMTSNPCGCDDVRKIIEKLTIIYVTYCDSNSCPWCALSWPLSSDPDTLLWVEVSKRLLESGADANHDICWFLNEHGQQLETNNHLSRKHVSVANTKLRMFWLVSVLPLP
jgi:hypothetical protein